MLSYRTNAIRGATSIEQDQNHDMRIAVTELYRDICMRNNLKQQQIISIIFSQTKDITRTNPARELRLATGITIPLFCTQEPEYEQSLPYIVRMLIHARMHGKKIFPVYLNRASALRTDIATTHKLT